MYVIVIYQQRPSEHRLEVFRENFNCPHAKQHVDLLRKVLDVIAYDCGVRQGEFSEVQGRVQKITELINELKQITERKSVAGGE